MPNELLGQVAIITGGGRGIGRTAAQMLAAEGAAVAVVARTEEQVTETAALIVHAGGRALPLTADVADRHAVDRVVEETERQLGPVDLLVNNAAVEGPVGPIWEVDPEEWWRAVEINLRGTFLCARAVLAGMVERGSGRIVNVSTLSAFSPSPYSSAYACSKAAGVNLTESLARAAHKYGIAVFALNPGLVETAMTEHLMQSPEGRKWFPFYRLMSAGHWLPPERAGELIVFLASGKADCLSGRFIDAYGDEREMLRRAEEIEREDLYALRLRL